MTAFKPLDCAKFQDPDVTADGSPRAQVPLETLETLWINTGTLCNLSCGHCYIESTPRNDRLLYIKRQDVQAYLAEIRQQAFPVQEIGFTGGEPFMNPEIMGMLTDCLEAGFEVLVLTNAMKPMDHHKESLKLLQETYGAKLTLRVSLDHYTAAHHDEERGEGSFVKALEGLKWLADEGFSIAVAGRTVWDPDLHDLQAGYASLFAAEGISLACDDPARLVLFPEMDDKVDTPEITTACWDILGKRPSDVMCAKSRMVVHHKGQNKPAVMPCTLIAYDQAFVMGQTLQEASAAVKLNHPHCSKFCVLGGASCS